MGGMGGMGGAGSMPPTVKVTDGVLTDPQGLTLYTFDRDTKDSGKSACNGTCATTWPPLMAAPGSDASGSYTVITRDDGGKQWAYRGMPLYRFPRMPSWRPCRRQHQQCLARRQALTAPRPTESASAWTGLKANW